MTYAERMQQITEADNRRRLRRRWEEAVAATSTVDYHHSRNITGEPSEKNRNHKASDDCWKRGLQGRTFGSADGKTQSVKVTKNGRTTIESARGFGRVSIATKSAQHNRRHISHKQEFARDYNERIGPAA